MCRSNSFSSVLSKKEVRLLGERQFKRTSIGLGYSPCLDMPSIFHIAMG